MEQLELPFGDEIRKLSEEIVDDKSKKYIYESPDGGKTIYRREFGKYDFYKRYYKHFQVLNLLRILPYSKNKNHIDNLTKEIRLLCLL